MRQSPALVDLCRPASLGSKLRGFSYATFNFTLRLCAHCTANAGHLIHQATTTNHRISRQKHRCSTPRLPKPIREVILTSLSPSFVFARKAYNLEDPHPSPAVVGGLARSWQHGCPQTTSDRPTRTTRAILYMRICSMGTSRLRRDPIHR